jgi:uncharacterized membrane protein YphA (DoxX/SURF4 family)
LWTASALLAALFLAAGLAKFASAGTLETFARWGYPLWFARLVGAVEIGAGLLLLWPRMAWRAAAVLLVVMVGAVGTLLYAGEPVQSLLPAALLAPLALVGYYRHPRATLKARLQAAVDWVAERELAEAKRHARRLTVAPPKFPLHTAASATRTTGSHSEALPR